MEETKIIYSLSCPKTGEVRYIGQSGNIKERYSPNFKEYNKSYKTNWITSLSKENLLPILEIIDEVPKSEWKFWEKYWISQFRTWGFKLVNRTEGGDGVSPGNIPWNKGLKYPNVHSAWNKGIKGSTKANSGSFKKGHGRIGAGNTKPNSGSFKKGIIPKNKTILDETQTKEVMSKYFKKEFKQLDVMQILHIGNCTLIKLIEKYKHESDA